jgi:hypothetical protein
MNAFSNALSARRCMALAVALSLWGGAAAAADSVPGNVKAHPSRVQQVNPGSQSLAGPRNVQPQKGKSASNIKSDNDVTDYKAVTRGSAGAAGAARAPVATPGAKKGVKWEGPDFDAAKGKSVAAPDYNPKELGKR